MSFPEQNIECPKCDHELAIEECAALGCEDGCWEDEDGINGNRQVRCDECRGTGWQKWCRTCGWDAVHQCFLSEKDEQGFMAKQFAERQRFADQTMSNHQIIAVDFDGTCVMHEYPEVGADVPEAVCVLKKLNRAGVKIIVWTMRCGMHLDTDARDWFEEREIEIWGYNVNPEQHQWTDSPKSYAHAYIDDAAIGCPLVYPNDGNRPYVNWLKIEAMLTDRGFFNEMETRRDDK